MIASSEYGATRYIRGFLDEARQSGEIIDFCYFGPPQLAALLDVESRGEVVSAIDFKAVDLVVTGTGIGETIDKKMWRAAAKHGVPSRALIDHWSVYPQRFRDGKNKCLFPTSIGVLDEKALGLALLSGYPKDRCFIAGNPRFLSLANGKPSPLSPDKMVRVCFLHEDIDPDLRLNPDLSKNMSFLDLFHGFCSESQELNINFEVTIRAHPAARRQFSDLGPVDESPDLQTLLASYDVFVGVETMLLVELMLMGAYCISCYQPQENNALYLGGVPLTYANHPSEIARLISSRTRTESLNRKEATHTWLAGYHSRQSANRFNVFAS